MRQWALETAAAEVDRQRQLISASSAPTHRDLSRICISSAVQYMRASTLRSSRGSLSLKQQQQQEGHECSGAGRGEAGGSGAEACGRQRKSCSVVNPVAAALKPHRRVGARKVCKRRRVQPAAPAPTHNCAPT